VDACKILAEVIECNTVRGGVVAPSGTKRDAGGAGKGLPVTGEGYPEAAANFVGRAGADDERHRTVIVGEERGVDRVERVLGVEEHLAERAARSVGCGE